MKSFETSKGDLEDAFICFYFDLVTFGEWFNSSYMYKEFQEVEDKWIFVKTFILYFIFHLIVNHFAPSS